MRMLLPTVGTIVVCILPYGGCNHVQIISSMIVLAHDFWTTSMNSKNSCPCHLSHLHIFPFASNVKHIYCPQLIFQTMWLLHFGSLGLILCPQCLPLKSRSTLPFVLMPILFLLDWCLFYILQFWHRSRFPIFCFSLAMSIFHFAIILHFPLLCFFPVTYLRTSSSSIVVPWSRWSRIDESGQTQPACTGDIACATVDDLCELLGNLLLFLCVLSVFANQQDAFSFEKGRHWCVRLVCSNTGNHMPACPVWLTQSHFSRGKHRNKSS